MSIAVRVTVAGWHHWDQAPHHRSYLRSHHRHLFNVKAEIEIPDSRSVEFHDLQAEIRNELLHIGDQCEDGIDFGGQSCEQIAQIVVSELLARHHPRRIRVEVWEDNECGGICEDEPTKED